MCGTTRLEDAAYAASLGVDALGFIFARKSPRYIEPERARQIIAHLPPFVARVGVFVNSDLPQVKEVTASAGLTQVQLHGSETVDYCRELKNWNSSLTVCKAFSLGTETSFPDIGAYNDAIDCLLFDTYVKGKDGGTGRVFDWSLVERLCPTKPLILAGGLNPDNVVEAIRTVDPYAVGVNSGVEDRPGIKNHEQLRKLVFRVRQMEMQNSVI